MRNFSHRFIVIIGVTFVAFFSSETTSFMIPSSTSNVGSFQMKLKHLIKRKAAINNDNNNNSKKDNKNENNESMSELKNSKIWTNDIIKLRKDLP